MPDAIDAGRGSITSRGFTIDTIQVDGVPTVTFDNSFATAFDLFVYDRIEVLRGPNGLFQGGGNPGGAINLARKRALAVPFAQAGALLGAWDFRRGQVDVSGPLNSSGTVRGRFAGAYEDRGYFYDVAEAEKAVGFGTLEFDLSDRTTFSFGGALQDNTYTPFFGLPAYADGRLLDVKRSTFLGADWNRVRLGSAWGFAELHHRFDNGGHAKASAHYVERTNDFAYAYPTMAVDPATGLTRLSYYENDIRGRNVGLDAHVSSPLHLFGQTHNILLGIDYRTYRFSQNGFSAQQFDYQDVFAPNPHLPKPDPGSLNGFLVDSVSQQKQYGVYGQARIKPTSWATVILGGRVSNWNLSSENFVWNTSTAYGINHQFTPYAGLVLDLTPQISLYGSYTEIFQPQSALRVSGELLPPRIGEQYEVGLKGSFYDGRLNASLAFFRIRDQNRSLADPDHPGFSIPAGLVQSQGFEAEISGELSPGWQVFAGYAYTETEFIRGTVTQTGQPFTPLVPKHNFSLWTTYAFQGGMLEGFTIGGGVKALSNFYNQVGTVRFEQSGYAVVSAMIGYRFNERFQASLTVNNLFDRVYYERVLNATGGNRFGEPRSVWLTATATW